MGLFDNESFSTGYQIHYQFEEKSISYSKLDKKCFWLIAVS